MSIVTLSGVGLWLAGRRILSDVSLAIEPGEFIGLLGANGAGKTTLLKAILGLLAPTSGEIQVFGAPASRGNASIGYMPQSRISVPWTQLSGRAFVASAAGRKRWGLPTLSAAEWRDVDEALALVGAEALAQRPLAELSGGERQRLLLAQALLGRPGLLLLDEPLIHLDPRHQQGVVDLVRALQKRLSLTVLFAAHELNPLLGALDRVLYLGEGHAALGSVDEVMTGPVLSRLYGTDIEVVRIQGRIFVMAGAHDVERADHLHGCGHSHEHNHGHEHTTPHGHAHV